MAKPDLKTACLEAYSKYQGNCSGAVKYVARQMGYDLPDYTANGLVDYFNIPANGWARGTADQAQQAADKNRLVVAGKRDSPNGHLVVVMPGGKVASGGYFYTDNQGKVQKAANHGFYPRALSTSLGTWPGAKSKGDKSVFDAWGNLQNYLTVLYWFSPLRSFSFNSITPGAQIVSRIPILKGKVWKYTQATPLSLDVPANTLFKVGGVQMVEKWVDVEAVHLVPLKLRVSAEEFNALFEEG